MLVLRCYSLRNGVHMHSDSEGMEAMDAGKVHEYGYHCNDDRKCEPSQRSRYPRTLSESHLESYEGGQKAASKAQHHLLCRHRVSLRKRFREQAADSLAVPASSAPSASTTTTL